MKARFYVYVRKEGDVNVVCFVSMKPRLGMDCMDHESYSLYLCDFGWANGWWFGGRGDIFAFEELHEELKEYEVSKEQYDQAWDNCCMFTQWMEHQTTFDFTIFR